MFNNFYLGLVGDRPSRMVRWRHSHGRGCLGISVNYCYSREHVLNVKNWHAQAKSRIRSDLAIRLVSGYHNGMFILFGYFDLKRRKSRARIQHIFFRGVFSRKRYHTDFEDLTQSMYQARTVLLYSSDFYFCSNRIVESSLWSLFDSAVGADSCVNFIEVYAGYSTKGRP